MSPLVRGHGEWTYEKPVTPTEFFGDALMWRGLADHYPGWWTTGAREKADDAMAAALEGAGLCC